MFKNKKVTQAISSERTFLLFAMASLMTFVIFWSGLAQAGNTSKAKPDVAEITAEQLLENRDDYVVLDVRTMGEFAIGHIDGAINISHHDIEDELERLRAIDKPIVVHCRSGKRAAAAERILLQNNITNIYHLQGDMLGWKEKDLPLSRGLN